MCNKKYPAIILLLLFLSSCAVKKPSVSKIEIGEAVSRAEKKALITGLENTKILYTTFNGKAKTNLEVNNKSFNATLNLRIKHQESIWISVTAFLGIEVARILITPDRIQIINRLQSEYTDKPFDYIYNFTSDEMGFNDLENLLVGNKMRFAFNSDINFLHTSLGYEAQGNNGDLDFLMQFGKDYSLLQNKLYQQSTNQTLTSNYADFQEIAGLLVPKNIQILIMAEKLNLNAIMNYDNINLNQELSFPFQVPSGFKQIN